MSKFGTLVMGPAGAGKPYQHPPRNHSANMACLQAKLPFVLP